MVITKIELTHFKNYTLENVQFGAGYNLLTGNNGQGKTNLLDAIYMLCITKSHFQSQDKTIIQPPANFFRLSGYFEQKKVIKNITYKYSEKTGKIILIDDKELERFGEHLGKFPITLICPGDIALIEDGSESRRRFLDITLCQFDPNYLKDLNIYNQVLKQRNSLLKSFDYQYQSNKIIEFYDEQLIQSGMRIMSKRFDLIQDLKSLFNQLYDRLSDFQEKVTIEYLPNAPLNIDEYKIKLIQTLEKDKILKRTTVGIHKDNIEFLLMEKPIKQIGSQGQIKSAIFAAKLAQYQWLKSKINITPILLCDDIFDKLDPQRVENLLSVFDQQDFGQVFITDTYSKRLNEKSINLNKEFCHFEVINGKLSHARTRQK